MQKDDIDFGCIFAIRLAEVRKKRNLTQRDLADKTNIPAGTISSYEMFDGNKGKRPSLPNAIIIAKVLNVSLDFLCGLEANDKDLSITDTVKQVIKLNENNDQLVIDELDLSKSEIGTIMPNIASAVGCLKEIDKIAVMAFKSDSINYFLTKSKKIKQLYNDGDIDENFYQMWLNQQYKTIAEQEEEN